MASLKFAMNLIARSSHRHRTQKDAKPEVILAYIFNKTQLKSSYSANVVAIVNGRQKLLISYKY
jgi:DNA gyrase/topoisomerase IV subunit A